MYHNYYLVLNADATVTVYSKYRDVFTVVNSMAEAKELIERIVTKKVGN